MKTLIAALSTSLAFNLVSPPSFAQTQPNPLFEKWAAIKTPSKSAPKILGGYAGGCIAGAEPLPLEGEGYLVLRASRNRFYGHPNLVSYLKSLGRKAKDAGLPKIMYGDLSAPRGGPFLRGHSSHQNGLDVDISFSFATKKMEEKERNSFVDPVLVVERKQVSEQWTAQHNKLVELAASSSEVARIFVAPGVKRELCKLQPQAPWLYKVRSWWGHDDHLHVRLNCPADSASCEPQAALNPNDNGCGAELISWLSKKADAQQAAMDEYWSQPNPPPRKFPKSIPAACGAVRTAN